MVLFASLYGKRPLPGEIVLFALFVLNALIHPYASPRFLQRNLEDAGSL